MLYKRTRKFLPQGDAPAEEYKLYLASESTYSYGKMFLADFNKSEPSIFHFHFCDELDKMESDPLFSIVARGHAKTTICKANILKDLSFTAEAYYRFYQMSKSHLKSYWHKKYKERIAFGNHYIIWIAKGQEDSVSNAEYISKNLEENPKIIKHFGKLKGSTWNQEKIKTKYGDVLQCGSNLKNVRGKNIYTKDQGAIRITRVILDDAENEENTKTFASRRDIKRKVFAAIIPAIQHKPYCRLIVTGTPVHFDSMVQNIIDDVAMHKKNGTLHKYPYKVLIYKATQPNLKGGVLWHSYMPRKKLNAIKARYAAIDLNDLYYQEYELEVAGSDVAAWTRKHFKIHNAKYIYNNGNFLRINNVLYPCTTFLGCDPATDIETRTSDFSVVSAVAVLADNSRYSLGYERHLAIPTIGVRDKENNLVTKKGVVDYIFEMYDRFHCEMATVENVAMTRSVFQSITSKKINENRFDVNIRPISPAGKHKHNKIYSYLEPMFASGMIHYRELDDALISETIRFGKSMAHDDTIESFYFANVNAYPPESRDTEQAPTLDYWEKREKMLLNRAYYKEAIQGKLPWFLKDKKMSLIN